MSAEEPAAAANPYLPPAGEPIARRAPLSTVATALGVALLALAAPPIVAQGAASVLHVTQRAAFAVERFASAGVGCAFAGCAFAFAAYTGPKRSWVLRIVAVAFVAGRLLALALWTPPRWLSVFVGLAFMLLFLGACGGIAALGTSRRVRFLARAAQAAPFVTAGSVVVANLAFGYSVHRLQLCASWEPGHLLASISAFLLAGGHRRAEQDDGRAAATRAGVRQD